MQSGTLPTTFPPQTLYVLSAHSSAMVTAMHSLQSPLDAHVANWFAQVWNSYIQHIAQSSGPSGHTAITTCAIASVNSSIQCTLTMLLPWRRPSARLPLTLTELHMMSLLTLLWTSVPKLSSEPSLSSIRAHPCTWNIPSSLDSTKTERQKTWKEVSAPGLQRLHTWSAPPPASVIPFVIDATGHLGPAAISFLLRICPTQTFVRTHFLNAISLICARLGP